MIFISHELSVIRYVADRAAVKYRSRIVEIGETDALLSPPDSPARARCCPPFRSRIRSVSEAGGGLPGAETARILLGMRRHRGAGGRIECRFSRESAP
jgi:hypothetical protein